MSKPKGFKGIFENVISNVKKGYEQRKTEREQEKQVYREAYRAAKVDAIKQKARDDAKRAVNPPPVKPKKYPNTNPFSRY